MFDPRVKTREILKRVRKRISTVELRAWADRVLGDEELQSSSDYGWIDSVPEHIRMLDPEQGPPRAVGFGCGQGGDRCVFVWWGGGFGMWGLQIGHKSYRPDETKWYALEWVRGIYVVHSIEP
jgi:hypothetical protein